MRDGDQNTAFFHLTVQTRAAKNGIKRLVTASGVVLTDPNKIMADALDFYH